MPDPRRSREIHAEPNFKAWRRKVETFLIKTTPTDERPPTQHEVDAACVSLALVVFEQYTTTVELRVPAAIIVDTWGLKCLLQDTVNMIRLEQSARALEALMRDVEKGKSDG